MQWFGFGPDAVGRKCWEVYRWGKEQEDASPIVVAAKTGKPQTRIQEFTDRAGVWHCCEHVFTPVEHRETRLIVLSLDITEQRQRAEQVRLIDKLTEKVEASLDLDRVLHLVLTCATAGHAIGLNRAFVFLLDADRRELVGEMAVGPVSWPDAQRIWNDLSQRSQSIEQFLDSAAPSEGDRRLTELVRPVRVSVSDTEDVLVRTLNSCSSAYVGDARTTSTRSLP
jgi:hypothetical protein